MGNSLKSRLHMGKKDKGGERPSRNDNNNQAKIDEAIMSGPNRARAPDAIPSDNAFPHHDASKPTNARAQAAINARDAAAGAATGRDAVAAAPTARDAEPIPARSRT